MAAEEELYLKCKAVGQPYIDKMNADPPSPNVAVLHAELLEKINAITWEYTLRQDAMNTTEARHE